MERIYKKKIDKNERAFKNEKNQREMFHKNNLWTVWITDKNITNASLKSVRIDQTICTQYDQKLELMLKKSKT